VVVNTSDEIEARSKRRLSGEAKRGIGTSAFAVVMLVAASVVNPSGLFRSGEAYQKLIAVGGALIFIAVGAVAVHNIANESARRTRLRMSASHAGAIRLTISLAGYLAVAVMGLNELGVQLGQLLVGGALTGVIIGIAAQQSLGNVFAGLMLVISRPFIVGDHIIVHSGGLGGPHEGRVIEMGLVYLTIKTQTGLIRLPNTAVLNSAVAPNGHAE
jgi:small conductance mechanosensitive channel